MKKVSSIFVQPVALYGRPYGTRYIRDNTCTCVGEDPLPNQLSGPLLLCLWKEMEELLSQRKLSTILKTTGKPHKMPSIFLDLCEQIVFHCAVKITRYRAS